VQPLDNPAWHALTGPHATVAEGGELARRYRPEYSVWSAVGDAADPDAWSELRAIVGEGGHAMFGHLPRHPAEWETVRSFPVRQLVLDDPIDPQPLAALPAGVLVEPLTPKDVEEMGALARATEPGPWCERTAELGDFFGIRIDGQLVAMAGERLRLPTAVEISGVCTDASHRGQGFAAALVVEVARQIQARNATAFLHVRDANAAAINVYERLGFRCRTVTTVSLVRAPERVRHDNGDIAPA
jgi:Predicted acetyltransferase